MNTATNIDAQIAELNAQKEALEQIARDEKRAEEKKAREKQRIADLKKYQEATNVLAADLLNADTSGVLSFKTNVDAETNVPVSVITFKYKGRDEVVDIEEHLVYSSTGRSFGGPKNHGLKYRLTGGYNDYSKRMYKTAKSVLKKIAEIQEIDKAVQNRESEQVRRNREALELLTSLYTDCDVSQSQEWVGGYGASRGYERTIFVVKGQHGTVNFIQGSKDGITTVSVAKMIPTDKFRDEMADMILLG